MDGIMNDKMTEKERLQYRRELFIKLLIMLRVGAMQQLGLLENPFTGEKKVNLELARETIDIIDVLKEKTIGNLTEEEQEMIANLLSELYVSFVRISGHREGNEKDR